MNLLVAARKLLVIVATFTALAAPHPKVAAATSLPSPASGAKQLSDLVLRTPSGEQLSLLPHITHKAIVVVFWAAWCPICHGEAPRINEISTNPDVKVVAVNEGDSPGDIRDFIAANKVRYQVVLDPASDVAKAFGVPGMPYCVIIDRSGIVVYRGYKLPDEIDYYIK